jgi:coproporphyrinogen III oxidase-like Fe-S oxidoreductase
MKKILLPHQLYYPYLDIIKERADPAKLNDFVKTLEEDSTRKGMLYIHLPFCNSKCSFCGFDKAYNPDEVDRYLVALKGEIAFYAEKPYVQRLAITGIHIGGGTPTLLPHTVLADLIEYVRGSFKAGHVPLNLECSPTTLDDNVINLLKGKNVSRVSMGVQSFDPELRNHLNILSTLEETYAAISKLKEAGVVAYIDIMYGFPDFGIENQLERAIADVRTAVELDVEGVDFSQFYPFHNPLERRIAGEGLLFPSSEDMVNTILSATSILESAGYQQITEYIFRKKGDILLESAYFGDSDCVAVGPSSLGMLNGYKYMNKKYSQYIKSDIPQIMSLRRLTGDELLRTPIVGFPRLLQLQKNTLSAQLRDRFADKLNYLLKSGLLEESSEAFLLTGKGRAYINNIYFFLMDESEQKEIENRLKILKLE